MTPKELRPELQDRRPEVNGQTIMDEQVVAKSFLNNSSINQDSFKNELSAIAGYPEGSPITVTYYSQNTALTDIRSHNVDLLTEDKDVVHINLTEIRNFELRLSDEIDFNYDADSNVSECNGNALVFAGFEPKINDFFLYELRNGKIGIFIVSSIQRLALGQDTYHRITFTLQEYLTPERKTRLKTQTTAVFYFDKRKFLTGDHAFMTTEGYVNQKDLNEIKHAIIQNFTDRYYRKDMKSFIRADGLYDPYVVEYWNRKINYSECGYRPRQLLVNMQNYNRTIWSAMTNNPIHYASNYQHDISKGISYANFWTLSITPLLGMAYIKVGDEHGGDVYTAGFVGTIPSNISSPYFHNEISLEERSRNFSIQFKKEWDKFYAKTPPHQHCPLGYLECQDVFDFNGCRGCNYLYECKRWYWYYHADRPHKGECNKQQIHPYVFSKEFYNGSSNMTEVEHMVHDALSGIPVKVNHILNFVSRYYDWDNDDAFYYQLISFYLIDKALIALQNGR